MASMVERIARSEFLEEMDQLEPPLLQRVVRWLLRAFCWPFAVFLRRYDVWFLSSAFGHAGRLSRAGKHSDAYRFGYDSLKHAETLKKFPWFPFMGSLCWWSLMAVIAHSAVENSGDKVMDDLKSLFEKAPKLEEGTSVPGLYESLASLAWREDLREDAWIWAEKAVSNTEPGGWAFYFRAWCGIQLGKGDPMEDLKEAIKREPELKAAVQNDPMFTNVPGLLLSLGLEQKG